MSRYEEMFGLVGQLGAQLREGYAAGQAALGAGAEPSARRRRRSARSAARPSAAAWPRRCGAIPRACRSSSTARPRCRGWVGAGRPGAARVLQRRDRRDARGGALGARARRRRHRRDRGRAARRPRRRRRRPGRARPGRPAAARGARARSSGPWRPRSSTRAPSRRPPSDIRAAAHACDAVARDRGGSLASALGEARRDDHDLGLRLRPAGRRRAALQEPAEREREVHRRPSASCPRPTTTRSSAGPARARTGGRHAAIHLADPDDPPTIRASIATTPAPDRRRRDAPPRAHGRGPDAHGAGLLAALAARPRVRLHGARQPASIRSRSTASPSSSRRWPREVAARLGRAAFGTRGPDRSLARLHRRHRHEGISG